MMNSRRSCQSSPYCSLSASARSASVASGESAIKVRIKLTMLSSEGRYLDFLGPPELPRDSRLGRPRFLSCGSSSSEDDDDSSSSSERMASSGSCSSETALWGLRGLLERRTFSPCDGSSFLFRVVRPRDDILLEVCSDDVLGPGQSPPALRSLKCSGAALGERAPPTRGFESGPVKIILFSQLALRGHAWVGFGRARCEIVLLIFYFDHLD